MLRDEQNWPVCTVLRSHDTETGQVTEPGRVVSIKVDSLHTTASGRVAASVPAPQFNLHRNRPSVLLIWPIVTRRRP